METKNPEINKIIETLSPLERRIIPHLKEKIDKIESHTGLDTTSVLRALRFLESKNIIQLETIKEPLIELGTNGIYYKKNNLPERNLINLIGEKKVLSLEEAQKHSKLSENEFKVSLGILKGKALINLTNGKIIFSGSKEELVKRTFEEQLLEKLPIEQNKLPPELLYALEQLKKRKDIIEIKQKTDIRIILTVIGEKLISQNLSADLIEEVTTETIRDWNKNKKFRRYDIFAPVPQITGGKRHFVNEAIARGKKIWLELGFKEMTGNMTVTSFWNFDALFTAQDHPVREMQDTFFIKDLNGKLPISKELISNVKRAHESGVSGSKGWRYKWDEEKAKRVLIRTHTTCLSAQTLSKLKKEDLPAKFFAIGKCFRNETIDWGHGFEFNQTEGIVIDPNANLRHLIGYLTEFAKKMGYKKIKIQPSYFPYTEPSLEGYVWNENKKQWMEVIAAGIFRPEVTMPLLGTPYPVLAWGPGFDRLMMAAYEINDMREIYSNDLKQLRNKRRWI